MIRCRCGEENPDGALACAACGSPLALSAAEPAPDVTTNLRTSQIVAAEEPTRISPTPPELSTEPAPNAPARADALAACAACGAALQPGWRFCKACGEAVGAGAAARAATRHALVRMSPGGEAESPRPLREGRTVIGRTEGDYSFPHDGTMSSRHAAIVTTPATCEVADLGSTNGTFVSIRGDEALEPGDVIVIGQTRLLYRRAGRAHELVEILEGGDEGRRLRLAGPRVVLGKDRTTDMSFPDDDHVSRRHAEIVRAATGHVLRDLGSTNRTFRLITSRRVLRDGDRVLAGGQIFEYRRLS